MFNCPLSNNLRNLRKRRQIYFNLFFGIKHLKKSTKPQEKIVCDKNG